MENKDKKKIWVNPSHIVCHVIPILKKTTGFPSSNIEYTGKRLYVISSMK